jgi:short subunit fatty acids transporter
LAILISPLSFNLNTVSYLVLSAGIVLVKDPALFLWAIDKSISHAVADIFFYSASALATAISLACDGSIAASFSFGP